MKSKIILIAIILLYFGDRLCAQGSVQTFKSQGFRVKCNCNLYENSVFIEAAKNQGINNIIAAYICAENSDSAEKGVIINVNIYDETARYADIKPVYHSYFEKKCLEKYAENLSNAGFTYKFITYQGVSALEYTFNQMGLPTKAIMFYKNKKSYLLQVGTRDNLETKFNSLKTNFEFI